MPDSIPDSRADNPAVSDSGRKYWEQRKSLFYYRVVRALVETLASDVDSMLDIGSGNCPYLEWFPWIPNRFSLDLKRPYEAEHIQSITADFLEWEPSRKFNLVTCLQVLEHVQPARLFAQKLLAVSDVLVVSVPYRWPAGHTKSHVQDPVDEAKLMEWFGRAPNYEYICREITANVFRIIHVYDKFPDPWNSLSKRKGILNRLAPSNP